MFKYYKYFLLLCTLLNAGEAFSQEKLRLYGKVTSSEGEIIDFATVRLEGVNAKAKAVNAKTNGVSFSTLSGSEGRYAIDVPKGEYTITVKALGYESFTQKISINALNTGDTAAILRINPANSYDVILTPHIEQLGEVLVVSTALSRVQESAYNAVALDAKALHNSAVDLAGALAKAPGVKLRESGGLGSDMHFSLDGFSGRHIKFFIDGVPLEGAGNSFGINNIPINFAERIEVYRGVVPVGFGADALGGVVNIVTGERRRGFVDASYSFGSFNTHKSYLNMRHTTDAGLYVEVNAFQNYSDNSYHVFTPVKNLDNGQIDEAVIERVRRFNDTYHNETLILKVGIVGRPFADKISLALNLSQSEKELQNGVRQEIVFGRKRNDASSVMPSFEYRKRNLIVKNLSLALTANYNRNHTHNLDTATSLFNWRGESRYNNGKLGEQSYQDGRFQNNNYNSTVNAGYNLGETHGFAFNHVLTVADRRSTGDSENQSASSLMSKLSRKNISGLSYTLRYERLANFSVFLKRYNQYSSGPRNQATGGSYDYVLFSESAGATGYGAAATGFFLHDFQAKLSYEKAFRLPTTDELFGDEDLELGAMELKPERSDNVNLSLSYSRVFGLHSVYLQAGVLRRDTKDYIRRVTNRYTGGLFYASHENHGRVLTTGLNAELHYDYSRLFSFGGSLSSQNIRDAEPLAVGSSSQPSTTCGVRVPNIPYFFLNADGSAHFTDLFVKGAVLTATYGMIYVKDFPLYWENHGSAATKLRVPDQLSHDLTIVYSFPGGRYNLSLECRNFTDSRLYDNFSLQKPGRAFYGKLRFFFGK